MIERDFISRTEWKKHLKTDWRRVHNLWPHLKGYIPGWGYSKAEIDAFFEGYDGGKAQVHWDRITNKPGTYSPSAHASSHEKGGSDLIDTLGDLTVDKLTIGSYYLNSLIANNKVPDSDRLDNLHASSFLQNPATAALDMNGYALLGAEYYRATGGASNLMVGDEIDGVNRLYTDISDNLEYKNSANNYGAFRIASLVIGSYYLNSLIANNKVPDSDKVDGQHASDFLVSPMVESLDMNGYAVFGAEYYRATGGATDLMVGDEITGVNRLFTDASNNLAYKSAADTYGAMIIASLKIGSYYLNSLIANNKVPDSDKVDGQHASDFLQSPMTEALDMGGYYIGNTDYIRTVGGTTDLALGKDIAGVNRLITDASNNLQYYTSGDVLGAIKAASFVLGSYYLNSLIANNKVPDSDKVDGEHASEVVTDARVKAHFPDTIANILSDHNLVAHTSLGLFDESSDVDHDQTTNVHQDVKTTASPTFVGLTLSSSLDMGGSPVLNAEYFRAMGGATNLILGDDITGVNRLMTDASNNLEYKTSADAYGAMKISSLVIGSYYLNSLIANNKVPDSDKLDGLHSTDFVANPLTAALDCGGYSVFNAEYYRASGGATDLMVGDEIAGVNRLFTDATNNLAYKNAANNYGAFILGSVKIGSYYINSLIANNKVPDSDKLDGEHGSYYSPTTHDHVKADITDTPWAWTDVSKTGSNLTDLATRQHAGLTDITSDQHHAESHVLAGAKHTASGLTTGHVIRATGVTTFAWAELQHGDLGGITSDQHHAISHETRHRSGGADELNHDNLAGFVAGEHFLQSAITTVGTIGTGVWQGTAIANAYVAGIDQNLLQASSPTFVGLTLSSSLDMGGSPVLNAEYFRAMGGATNLILGDDITGVNRLITDASNNLEYKTSADAYGAMKLSSVVIGSYYLNSLIANNKVPDSDKLDGLHSTDFVANPLTAALDCGGYSVFNAEYYRASGGATDLMVGDEITGVNRLFTDASNNLAYKSAADTYGAMIIASLKIGSYYLNSLIANNKVPDSDKVDNEHAADIVTDGRVKAHFPDTIANILSDHTKAVHDSLGLDHGDLSGKGDDDHTQYILASGTRAFTGVVSGVTPTVAAHLATKGYVDTQVGGVNEFTELTDTPSNYTGSAGKFVKVNATPDALVFASIAWADVSKTGSNLTDLATRQHAGLTDITSDQHHAQLHASEHEVGGGDLISHDDLTDFVAAEHVSLPNTIANVLSNHTLAVHNALAITQLGTVGTGVWQGTAIANAYIAGIDQNLLQASSPTFVGLTLSSSLDMGGSPVLDAEYFRATGGLTNLILGDDIAGVNRLITDASDNLEYKNAANNYGAMILGSLTIGSYYLNSLIANNKVPDSDKLDGEHGSYYSATGHGHAHGDLTGVTSDQHHAQLHASEHEVGGGDLVSHDDLTDFVASEHFLQSAITTVGTIGTGVWQGTAIANAYIAGIDQNLLQASSPTFVGLTLSSSLDMGGSPVLNAEYFRAVGGATNLILGDDITGVNRLITDASNNLEYKNASDSYGAMKIASLVIGSYYLNSLIANNKVPDSDKLDGEHGSYYSPTTHDHVKADITDTPWAWTDVSKTGSNLTDLVTRQHAGLTDVTSDQHHAESHVLAGAKHTASGLTTGHVIRATGVTTFAWAELQHGDLGGVTSDQHHAQLHASEHEVGGGDLVSHDDLTDFVASEHFLQSAITTVGTIGTGVWQGTAIANAYVAGIDQNLLQASSPTFVGLTLSSSLDMGGSPVLNAEYFRAVGGLSNLILGDDITGVNRLITDASDNLEYKNAANNYGAMKLSSVVIGSYYLNSLIANNKVPDSDKLDGLHSTDFVANPLTAALDCGGYSVFNAEYFRASGGATDLMVGDELTGVNRLYTDASDNLEYKNSANNYGAFILGSVKIGSYYLNSLIANNKVPDSDKLDGEHGSYYSATTHTHVKADITDTPWAWTDISKTGSNLTDLATRQHAGLTDVTSDQHHAISHEARHRSGGADPLNHDNLAGFLAAEHKSLPNTIAQVLSDHTKAAHDALNIDADTLDSKHASEFLSSPMTGSLNMGGYALLNAEYYRATGGATDLMMGDEIAGVNRLFTDASNNLIYKNAANGYGAMILSSLKIGSYYLNSLIANNKVPDSDKLDGYHGAEASTVNTYARRNSSGDINARLFKSEYDTTNPTCTYIMTQIDTVSNNYLRPSTKAQVIASLNLMTKAGGTFTGAVYARNHGTGTVDEVVNVCYGTSDTPPAVGSVTEGTIYIKYTP